MLKLLADENIRREVVDFLLEQGHDVTRPDAGTPDQEVIALAEKEKRILITHDLDFSNIFVYPPDVYCGIVLIRILPPSATIINHALRNLLDNFSTQEKFSGKLIILEVSNFRVYGDKDK
jgi:predicted nuclease of predicted toxin-antitoxin system